MDNILEVNDLYTSFFTHVGEVQAVRGASFTVGKGEAVGIVGESGCGKSVTMMSVLRLLTDTGKIKSGSTVFNGVELQSLKENEMLKIRGNDIGMIFQDPMTSLNPVFTIKDQLLEPLLCHKKISKQEAQKIAIEYLEMVGIPEPKKRLKQYPHEFSGGMRQRVMIAMALICNPKLLIADEPTTALDVTIQAQILDLMKHLKKTINTSIILITHDLGVVADICSRVNVMYGGMVVETGESQDIFYKTAHPYTLGLLESVPNPKTLVTQRLTPIEGSPPDLLNPPKGCPFAARCKFTMKICEEKIPPMFPLAHGHESRCWLQHEYAEKVSGITKGSKK